MIGILILIAAIFLYPIKKRWSILLFIAFSLDGLQILTSLIIGIKPNYLAVIYCVVIAIYSACHEPLQNKEIKFVKYTVKYFFIFLLCSALFSFIYYGFSLYQIFQGGYNYVLIISYFFLRKLKWTDIEWLYQKLFIITFATSILYIIQVFTGLTVLPYIYDINIDSSSGLNRYYNVPSFLDFFLFISVLFPKYIPIKYRKLSIGIFVIAILCTLGRTFISLTFLTVFIGLLWRGKFKKHVIALIIVVICGAPFFYLFSNRLEQDNTESDIKAIQNSDFVEYAKTGSHVGGTLTYRFAWLTERVMYLAKRPLVENIFGLGMISDEQPVVRKMYHFNIGLYNPNMKRLDQLYTPDIAYGNMLSHFGYIGSIFLLIIRFGIVFFCIKHKREHPLYFCTAITLISMIFVSFSGNGLSIIAGMIPPILIITHYASYNKNSKRKNA